MSGPTLTFGTVSPFTGYPRSTSGNLVVNCMNGGTASATVTICVSFGVGTGGTTTSNRTLASGSNKLGIRVTNGSTDIGDGSSYPMYGPFSGTAAANASVGGNLPLTVTIPSPATPPAPGSYATTFNGTSAVLYYNTGSFSTCPALIASGPASSQFSVPVSATVPTQCTVSATGLAFPTSSLLTSPVNATATVTTTCNASVPVTVALDNGCDRNGPDGATDEIRQQRHHVRDLSGCRGLDPMGQHVRIEHAKCRERLGDADGLWPDPNADEPRPRQLFGCGERVHHVLTLADRPYKSSMTRMTEP